MQLSWDPESWLVALPRAKRVTASREPQGSPLGTDLEPPGPLVHEPWQLERLVILQASRASILASWRNCAPRAKAGQQCGGRLQAQFGAEPTLEALASQGTTDTGQMRWRTDCRANRLPGLLRPVSGSRARAPQSGGAGAPGGGWGGGPPTKICLGFDDIH